MFTDIVGYSSMMSKDESHSLKLLEEHNRIIEPVIAKHSGEIIKYIGDSIFAKFDSPEKAVYSAVEFQYKLKERNRLTKRRDRIPLRVGIHLGSVIEKGDDLFGNDVNITSRIEGAAPIEGIAVSSDVVEAIEMKDNLYYRKMGHIKLKNIPEPRLIYKVYLNREEWRSESDESLLRQNLKRGINMVDMDEYKVLNTFSLAMLDIKVDSNDSDDMSYAEYLTKDIIADFQKINDIRVPERKDSWDSIIQGTENYQIALKLKVNNILENSIRFLEDKLEFSARLFSNISGEYVWEHTWQCKRENTSFIRHKLMTELCNYFDIELPAKLQDDLSREMTDNSLALKKYIDGRILLEKLSNKSALMSAYELFKEAVSLDSKFVEAHAKYAFVCMKLGYYDKCEDILDEAMDIADETDNDRGKIEVYNYLGNLYGVQQKLKKAQKNSEKALKMLQLYDDQSAESRLLYNLAGHMYYAGKPEAAITYLDRSRELKISLEENESLVMVYALYGNIYAILSDHSMAIEYRESAAAQCREMGMDLIACKYLVALAGSYQNIGNYDRAEDILKDVDDMEVQTFDEGKISLIRGRILIEKDDFAAALTQLKETEEIFQKQGNNRMLINTYSEYAKLYIQQDEMDKARKYIDLLMEYGSKIRDLDLHYLPESMAVYASADTSEHDISSLEKKLSENRDDPANYRQWYYLASAYAMQGKSEKASQCRKISQNSLKKLSECNSNSLDAENMLQNVFLHKKILN